MTYSVSRGLLSSAGRGGRPWVMRLIWLAAFASLVIAQGITLAHAFEHDLHHDEARHGACAVCPVKAVGDDPLPAAASFVTAPTVVFGLGAGLCVSVATDRALALSVRSRSPPVR